MTTPTPNKECPIERETKLARLKQATCDLWAARLNVLRQIPMVLLVLAGLAVAGWGGWQVYSGYQAVGNTWQAVKSAPGAMWQSTKSGAVSVGNAVCFWCRDENAPAAPSTTPVQTPATAEPPEAESTKVRSWQCGYIWRCRTIDDATPPND